MRLHRHYDDVDAQEIEWERLVDQMAPHVEPPSPPALGFDALYPDGEHNPSATIQRWETEHMAEDWR